MKNLEDSDDDYVNMINFLTSVKHDFYAYKIIPMYLVLVPLTVYTLIIKRIQLFEITILTLMSLKYAAGFTYQELEWAGSNQLFLQQLAFYLAGKTGLSLVCHWTYASQYLKTFFLTRGITKRAILIYE